MNWFKKIFSRKESRTINVISAHGSTGTVQPQRGYDNFARETYLKNVTAFRAIDEVAKSAASVPWKVFDRNEDGSREEVQNDSFNLILKRPNPDESFAFVMLKTFAYLTMCGNAFLERVALEGGPNKGQMRELYSHRPDRFKFKTSSGRLEQYIYTVDGRSTTWDVDLITHNADILQLKAFHPLDDWWGAAPTESGAREIDTSNAATLWNKSLLDNQGRPGMVFTLVGQAGQQQMDELERLLEQRSGPAYAGKDLIITGERGTGAQPYGWSPTDMDFSEGDIRLMRKIAMTYGVPPELLGIESATFNNRKEARLFFWENTVIWWLNYIKGELNNWLYPGDSNRFISYVLDDVPAFAEKKEMLWERAEKATFASINEKREMAGLENWGTEGDVILIDASKIPLGMEPPEETTTEETTKKQLLDEGYTEEEIDEMLIADYEEGEDEPDESKPYPNEHACRLNPPGKYDSFARSNCFKKHDGKCIDYIFGIKGNKSQVQAMRYKKNTWTAADARKHCGDYNGIFEAASKSEDENMKEESVNILKTISQNLKTFLETPPVMKAAAEEIKSPIIIIENKMEGRKKKILRNAKGEITGVDIDEGDKI